MMRSPPFSAVVFGLALAAIPARARAASDDASLRRSVDQDTDRAWSAASLRDLGLNDYVRRSWQATGLTLPFRTRLDRSVTAARLILTFTQGNPKVAPPGALAVLVNGIEVARLQPERLAPGGHYAIPVDARLLSATNELTFHFQVSPSAGCLPAGAWSIFGPDARMETHQLALRNRGGLEAMPLPFSDPLREPRSEIPFVFATPPTLAELHTAFVVAGYFGIMGARQLSFPVRIGSLPTGNAVVIGPPAAQRSLGLHPADDELALVDHPMDTAARLLVVSGSEASVAPLLPDAEDDAAGKLLVPGRLVRFSELLDNARLEIRGRRDGELRIPFRLLPGTASWRERGLALTLFYEQRLDADAPRGKLVVSLNGHYLATLSQAGGPRSPTVREAHLRLAQGLLAARNELVVSSEFEVTRSCPSRHPDEYLAVAGNSTLDLRDATELVTLPDLGQLGGTGFPFTRESALSSTSIVVPDEISPAEVSSLLSLAAHLARMSGAPAKGVELLHGGDLGPVLDRDLIVLGTEGDQPLFGRWAALAPARLVDGAIVKPSAASPAETLWRWLRGESTTDIDHPITTRSAGGIGLIASFASPLGRGRTVVTIAASRPEAMPDLSVIESAPALAEGRSDVVVILGSEVHSYLLGGSYVVGQIGPLERGLWWLSIHSYLLVALLLASSLLLAPQILRFCARRTQRRLTTVLLLVCCFTAAARADETTSNTLEAKAQFWEAQGRLDKAAEIWDQVLRIDPGSPAALAGVARCHAGKAVDPVEEQAITEARQLSRAGKYGEAAAAYRRVFGNTPPDGLTLEYYETLAGNPETLADAQTALGRLAAAQPGSAFELAYLRALSYGESTRRTAIRRLQALDAAHPGQEELRVAWQKALLWLHATREDRPLYERYLVRHPDDREVFAKRESIARGAGDEVARGYGSLNDGEVEAAAATFERLLAQRPKDIDALVGASWVALRQGRFRDARDLTLRARKLAPARSELWSLPLRTAEMWNTLEDAAEAQRRGRLAAAEALVRAVVPASPRDAAFVQTRLARILLQAGRAEEAERIVRPLAVGGSREAGTILVEALARTGRTEELARYERELTDRASSTEERRELQVHLLTARAEAAVDDARAIELLRQARELEPERRSTQLALLYRLLAHGDTQLARKLGDQLLAKEPRDPEGIAAAALSQSEDGDVEAAVRTLSRIETSRLAPPARALRDRLALEVRARDIIDHPQGGRAGLERRMAELAAVAGDEPELRAIVAATWAKGGDSQRAVTLVRELMATDPTPAVRLRCAGVLLQAHQRDANELNRLLDDLQAMPHLEHRTEQQISTIRTALILRQADQDRRAHEYRNAFLRLEPALQTTPDDPLLLYSLAQLEVSAGHPAKGLKIYRLLLDREPKNLSYLEGAAFAAVADGDAQAARALVRRALDEHPKDPAALLLAARISLARGDDASADKLLHVGLELSRGETPAAPDTSRDTTRALVAEATAEFSNQEPAETDSAPSSAQALRNELNQLDLRYAPGVYGGINFRFRSGDRGTSRLFEVDLPFGLELSPRGYGHFTLKVVPVYLTAGELALTDPGTSERFGSSGVILPFARSQPGETDAWGIAPALLYEYRGLILEAGSTPLGFHVMDFVGQLAWRQQIGPWIFSLRALRQAITDSVLSYGGQIDPRTGLVWGGVRREGGEVDLQYDRGDFWLHLYVGYAAFTGKRVATNQGGQYSLGGAWRFLRQERQLMSIGIDLFMLNFSHNLSFFTFGQGGYFSPQFFLFAGIPLTWSRRWEDWSIDAAGEVGANWYTQDSSPFFPNNVSLQSAREALPTNGELTPGSRFPGTDHVGAYGKLHLGVSQEMGRNWALEEMFDGQFSPAFSEILFTVRVRKICK